MDRGGLWSKFRKIAAAACALLFLSTGSMAEEPEVAPGPEVGAEVDAGPVPGEPGSEEAPAEASPEEPVAEQPLAEEPPPAPAEPPPPPSRLKPKYFNEGRLWPGSFIGMRLGFSAGTVLMPRFGTGSDSFAREPIGLYSPYIGFELGYAARTGYHRHQWGLGLTVEFSFLNLATPDYLDRAPMHTVTGLQVMYVPHQKYRFVFGLNPYVVYRINYPSDMILQARGYGFRGGVHRRMSSSEDGFLGFEDVELFAWVSWDRFTGITAGFDTNTKEYPTAEFVGRDAVTSSFMLMIGIQVNLPWNKSETQRIHPDRT